jgi:tetratricopeptide (TPR) repeat protein
MKAHRTFWIIAGISVAAALVAIGLREWIGSSLAAPHSDRRIERDRVTSEMIRRLDFDPRLRRPETQRAVELAAAFAEDPSLSSAESLYALGLRKYYGDFDTAGAEQAFTRARRARPDWAWPLNGLGIVQFVSGRRQEALDSFQRALELDPAWSRPEADMAILFRRAGEMGRALEHARAALRIEPDHPINHYNYGVILDELGRRAEARAEYESALAIAPDLPQAHYNLACGYARAGDLERALPPLVRAIELEPEFGEDARNDPDFDPVRHRPEFIALVRPPRADASP